LTITPTTRGSARHTSAIRDASRSKSWYCSVDTTRLTASHTAAVVDGVVEIIARSSRRDVDRELDVDFETAGHGPFSSGRTPCTPISRKPDMRMWSTARS